MAIDTLFYRLAEEFREGDEVWHGNAFLTVLERRRGGPLVRLVLARPGGVTLALYTVGRPLVVRRRS